MNLLQDVITYIRRIIKSPSNAQITDSLLIDYINRFLLMDVDARLQLFDLKTKYQFLTTPTVDRYNMPMYDIQVQPGNQSIASFPVYQGFMGPSYVNGVQVTFTTQKQSFFNLFPNIVQNPLIVGQGDGTAGPYTLQVPIIGNNPSSPPNPPLNGIIRGHIDITGILANQPINVDPPLVTPAQISFLDTFIERIPVTSVDSAVFITAQALDGSNITVVDSGQFLSGFSNYGLLMQQGNAPNGNLPLTASPLNYAPNVNTINYLTGEINVTFPQVIPLGSNITVQCYFFQAGLPRSILFYNNVLTLRSPPDKPYVVELDAYLTPAAFLNTENAIPFGYMSEYIARGAARKILSDTGDVEQFQFYEPLFKEQETLVWKRSQRQFTSTRTETLYSQGPAFGNYNNGYTGY